MKNVLLAGAVVLAAASPLSAAPLPEGFVHLSEIDPTIIQDIRYAGAENFLGRRARGYDGASCILTEKAARALRKVQGALADEGLGLVVFDCYRPAAAVADFVRWAREGGPADPRWHPSTPRGNLIREGYIAARSGHSRGSTVDLGIVRLEERSAGVPVECGTRASTMLDFGTGFDCFDPKSRTASGAVGADAQEHRRLLVRLMDEAGFRNYSGEWWHFTLRGEPYPKRVFDFPVTAP